MSTTDTRAHQLRVMELAATWATAELLSGLLRHPDLCARLRAGAPLDELTRVSGLAPRQLRSLLRALTVEELVEHDGDRYRLRALGRDAETYRGWLDLYVRGYRTFFHHAEDLWAGDLGDCRRDMHAVGVASNAMSDHDAIPLVLATIDDVCPKAERVLDVGCADGIGIVRLCQLRPELSGVGVEPDPDSAAAARRLADGAGVGDRVRIVTGELADVELEEPPDVVIFSFVLQELIGQTSEADVRALLADLGRRWPDAVVIVVEVDAAGRDDEELLRRSPQRRGYYNLYFLVHDLTAQVLLTFPQWRRLFAETGFTVAAEHVCDPAVDDTDLTAAFALRARPNGAKAPVPRRRED